MDDLVIGFFQDYGIAAVLAAVLGYLVLESLLDLAKDLLMDMIKAKRVRSGEDEWGND